MSDHEYDIEVDDAEVNRILSEEEKPYQHEAVLIHLNHEMGMSLAAIGRLFGGITRQSVQEYATKFGMRVKGGGDAPPDETEKTYLSDFGDGGGDDEDGDGEDEVGGLADLL